MPFLSEVPLKEGATVLFVGFRYCYGSGLGFLVPFATRVEQAFVGFQFIEQDAFTAHILGYNPHFFAVLFIVFASRIVIFIGFNQA